MMMSIHETRRNNFVGAVDKMGVVRKCGVVGEGIVECLDSVVHNEEGTSAEDFERLRCIIERNNCSTMQKD